MDKQQEICECADSVNDLGVNENSENKNKVLVPTLSDLENNSENGEHGSASLTPKNSNTTSKLSRSISVKSLHRLDEGIKYFNNTQKTQLRTACKGVSLSVCVCVI